MKRIQSLICVIAIVCFFSIPSFVLAQHPSMLENQEPKSYVIPYAMVIILTGLSLAAMLRPSRRQIGLKGNEEVTDDEG